MHQQHGARGFSFQLEEASPKPPELGRLDLDWSDLANPGSPALPAPEEPKVRDARASGTPLMPHAAADRRPEPRSLLAAFAPADAASGAPGPAPTAPPSTAAASAPSEVSAAPVVRRLRFPTQNQGPVGSSAEVPVTARRPSPRPSTRFADSIGQSRPLTDALNGALAESLPPEDLPLPAMNGPEDEHDAAHEPAELLRRANTLWSAATKTASDLGGRGLESGRLLAGQMSDALRERFEKAVEQRGTKAPVATASSPEPTVRDQALPAAVPSPRRLPFTLSKKSAGPLLALVAAFGMFMASRQLLGVGAVGLSKTAPSIPDLGEVAETGAPARTTKAPEGASTVPSNAPAPPMATEVVPLPAGLAWPGKGLLEVVTSEDELVYVDGVFTGRGPLRRVPVAPGEHEVSIRKEGSERRGTANVELGRTTRALFRGK